jgi:hypothetical protein
MNEEFANSNVGNLLEPDVLVPHDYLKTQLRSLPAEPEQLLLLAVVKDAIETFQRLLNAKTTAGKRQFRETEEWIWSDESDRVFSFTHVCEMLGLDPEYLRRGLRIWTGSDQRQTEVPKCDAIAQVSARAFHLSPRNEEKHPETSRSPDQRAVAAAHDGRRRLGPQNTAAGFQRRRLASRRQYSKRA